MIHSARYAMVVAWSEDDPCFVGTAPGFVDGGCHGDDEVAVQEEPNRIVEDVNANHERDGFGAASSDARLRARSLDRGLNRRRR